MELNFKTMGRGEPVIILHGLFGTLDNWQTIAKHLSEHFSVYIVDQRNHGRSPHAAHMDYPALAEDLRHFMERHWMYKAHLIGHSMGGKTVMEFALEHPDMTDKLVVVDIAPKAYPGGHEDIFKALFAVDLDAIQSRQEAEEILSQYIEDAGTKQFLLKNLSRKKEGTFEWKMNLPVLHQYYQEILAPPTAQTPFEGETLFIRGGRSPYVLDSDLPAIHGLFPAAQLETIANAGHWVHADAPAELLQKVYTFLTK